VRLVISDAHEGLKKAVAKTVSAILQRCRVHFMRNALAHVPRSQHQMVAALIRTAFVQENHAEARNQWRETADKLRDRFPKPISTSLLVRFVQEITRTSQRTR